MSLKTQKAPAKVTLALAKGSILSETSFYVVKEVHPVTGKVVVIDDHGHEINLSDRYVKEICISADHYETEEKKTMTELAELFVNSPRIAMTVTYITKATEKPKREYDQEKSDRIQQIMNASLGSTAQLLNDLIENPLTREIPGKLRTMKGRHYGNQDNVGRVHFVDMELVRDTTKDYDTRTRQVDPRTIQELIINKVKYILK